MYTTSPTAHFVTYRMICVENVWLIDLKKHLHFLLLLYSWVDSKPSSFARLMILMLYWSDHWTWTGHCIYCAPLFQRLGHPQWLNCIGSTPEIVARNIAEVESCSTSSILRATISGVDTRLNNVARNIARNVAPSVECLVHFCGVEV